MGNCTCRRPQGSWPTPSPRTSGARRRTRRARCWRPPSWCTQGLMPRSNEEARMLLMIDNYDSFTYNLVQYLGELGEQVKVVRNDEVTLDEIAAMAPGRIVISPGPCTPNEAGVSLGVIDRFKGRIPILGVCLGHQAIGQAFGGKVVHARTLMHGKVSEVHHAGKGVFEGLPSPYEATRYHSLAIERASCPPELEVTAWTSDGEIMGVRHARLEVEGVQFHPESILTEHGHALLRNFLTQKRV